MCGTIKRRLKYTRRDIKFNKVTADPTFVSGSECGPVSIEQQTETEAPQITFCTLGYRIHLEQEQGKIKTIYGMN